MSSDNAQRGGSQPRSLAEKVEWLVAHMWPADQPTERAKTNEGIGEAIAEVTGMKFSGTTFWKLRTGRADNPTWDKLIALSKFFGVPLGYFGEDEESEDIADQVALLAAMRDNGLTRVALRQMAEMSSEGRQTIADMIESIARREQERKKRESGSGDA